MTTAVVTSVLGEAADTTSKTARVRRANAPTDVAIRATRAALFSPIQKERIYPGG
jgi:hypothetical protein